MPNRSSIIQEFNVPYRYQLFFTTHLFDVKNPLFTTTIGSTIKDGPAKLLFVIDANVMKAHPDLEANITKYCKANAENLKCQIILSVTGGELAKDGDTQVKKVLTAISDYAICRHSYVIAIGGGAVIDMVGYAAATAHRGVRLIRVPTTVLAQNDAAVGVKNGINILAKKNFLGTFAPPYAIINDAVFLSTLEQRDWISGISEAVKVALIKDAEFYGFISENAVQLAQRDMDTMDAVIYRCAELHMDHIAKGGDPFESGSSRPLDFGHWAAHKLEQMTNYGLRHGEAVAVGIALDVTYAQLLGFIDASVKNNILKTLETIGFDLQIPVSTPEHVKELLKGIEEFREHLGGVLTITLISAIGIKKDVHHIDYDKMAMAISLLSTPKKVTI